QSLGSFTLLQRPAHEYQQLMRNGQLTSEDLVTSFLDQIDRHNEDRLKLKAILSVCPRNIALARARKLDEERARGQIRGELHGIPIILKDAIVTHPSLGMVTSAGSCAIASLVAKRNATVVDKLLEAGIIVLGKGNLTVCGGSSVGPAVSIAAGFSPLGIGTETGGSNVLPASANGLYGLTLPHGSVPIDGISRIGAFSDRVGLMARDPHDLVALAKVLLLPPTSYDVVQALEKDGNQAASGWKGLSIGILDSQWGIHSTIEWKWGSDEVKEKYASVAKKLEELGARVVYPLQHPPQWESLKFEGETLHTTLLDHEFADVLEDFIATNFERDSSLANLADVVAWNEAHADKAMPEPYTTQTELIKALNDTMTSEKYEAAATGLRHLARQDGMAKFMRDVDLDIVLSASDASLISFSSSAGWPVATVPVANLAKNDQPWG
ncbi:amidase signature enzyme, partial [Cryphonectria parasitica EP155]